MVSPPYDVVTSFSAARMAEGNPVSFLHVTRAEIDLPDGTAPRAPEVYAAAAAAWRRFRDRGWLVREPAPALFAYRLESGGHAQTGLAALVDVEGLETGAVRRHELTRPDPEEDRLRHIEALNAQAEPVLLAYRDRPDAAAAVEAATAGTPLFDVTAADGVRHTGWRLPAPESAVAAFASVPAAYIADGHHRAAGAARAARRRRERGAAAAGSFDGLLAVLFPASRLRILPYHRTVADLGGLPSGVFLERVRAAFDVSRGTADAEVEPGRIDLWLADGRYRLTPRGERPEDPVAALDVSVLQERLLAPILGIADPRSDPRLQFVGGADAADGIGQALARDRIAAAFLLAPPSIEAMMSVADLGRTMPPKSTWFDPKLGSGLFVHELD